MNKYIKIFNKFDTKLINSGNAYSFMNFASLESYFISDNQDIVYFCDGMLMSGLVTLISSKKVERVSFDFTSIADQVFNYCLNNKLKIAFIGSSRHELDIFIQKIESRYLGLEISFLSDGYFSKGEEKKIMNDIIRTNTDVVIVGLGAGKQEEFLTNLHSLGYEGCGFTCGGFIRQESTKISDYYPHVINALNIRFLYRMFKEPHTIKRYLISYPINLIKILHFLFVKKSMAIEVLETENVRK